MSNNHISFLPRFLVSACAALCVAILAVSPAAAQQGIYTTTFPVKGLSNVYVNASGGLLGRSGEGACPFSDRDVGKIASAFSAASGDPDSCPHADGGKFGNIYLSTCGGVYHELSLQAADVLNPEMNMNLLCCERAPGPGRDDCRNRAKGNNFLTKVQTGFLSKKVGVPPREPGVWSREDLEKFNEKKKEEAEEKQQCFDDTFNKIEKYWTQKRGVSCANYVIRSVKNMRTNVRRELQAAMEQIIAIGSSSTSVWGAVTAVASAPSPWGAAIAAAVATGNLALEITKLSEQVQDIMGNLEKECRGIIPGLEELRKWRENVLGVYSCRALEDLLERQLTQCIRINLDASSALRLPQFSAILQCPVNINISARLTPSGFDCYAQASVGSPVRVSGGRRSLLSGNGGLENLFNGKCFTSPTTRPGSGGVYIPDEGNQDKTIPGVDCGPLDPNKSATTRLRGQEILAQKHYGDNAWAKGGSETVGGQQVTRCDQYTDGRLVKTTYVFGDGSSCRSDGNGFRDAGGYETNTACYGGYTPKAKPNVPDACLYDAGCLNQHGRFDYTKTSGSQCPDSTPRFDAGRQYNTHLTGGVDMGGGAEAPSCSDFSSELDEFEWCCNPKTQDCRYADANVPLCACDEGGMMNMPGADGLCDQGGRITCCDPILNGGEAGCRAMNTDMPICQTDIANPDQCYGSGDGVTIIGPDGRPSTGTVGGVNLTKASPYLYLFVRPDVTLPDNKQCCSTEWCNICPQHYANAYGLSLKQSTQFIANQETGNESHNRGIIGQGWPYIMRGETLSETTDEPVDLDTQASYEYLTGYSQVPYLQYDVARKRLFWIPRSKSGTIPSRQVPLHINSSMALPRSLSACDAASTPLKAILASSDNFGFGNGMGFMVSASKETAVYASVPMPQEYPLDYLNRLRSKQLDEYGLPLPDIQLCSAANMCTPGANSPLNTNRGGSGGGSGGGLGGGGIQQPQQSPYTVPSVTTPLQTIAPPTTVPSATNRQTTTGTQVPSATTSSGSGPAPIGLY